MNLYSGIGKLSRVVALGLGLGGGMVHAAISTFTPNELLAQDGSNLDKSFGRIVLAVNWSNSGRAPTVNGIYFTAGAFTPGAGGVTDTPAYTLTMGNDGRNMGVGASGYPSTAAVYPLFQDTLLLNWFSISGSLTLKNLTVGKAYKVQMVFSTNDFVYDGYVIDATSGGHSGYARFGTIGDGGPRMVTGVFTADSDIQTYNFRGNYGGLQFAAFTLQTESEPGTVIVVL